MFRIATALIAIVLLVMPVAAEDFGSVWARYKQGDYATAIKVARVLAERGDALSQTALASLHFMGRDGPRDLNEALRLHRLASETRNPVALGLFYSDSHVEPEFIEAYKWFNPAADRGMWEADWRLGSVADLMAGEQNAAASIVSGRQLVA